MQHVGTAIVAMRRGKMKELDYVASFALEIHSAEMARAINGFRTN